MKATVYLPQNGGLQFARAEGLKRFRRVEKGNLSFDYRETRGEMIPELIESANGPAFGITGEDLLMESGTHPSLYQRLWLRNRGAYENTVFGLPSLCLLSGGGMSPTATRAFVRDDAWVDMRQRLDGKRIAVPTKYRQLVSKLLGGVQAEWVYLTGGVDIALAENPVVFDKAVDIVLTGGTLELYGLGIERLLKMSDGVIAGNNSAMWIWLTTGDRNVKP